MHYDEIVKTSQKLFMTVFQMTLYYIYRCTRVTGNP